MSKNKVTFGLEKVHVAFRDDESAQQPEWETPVAIPGAVRWTPTAVGDTVTHYADNIAYFTVTVNNGYTGELELTNVPDEILAKMLGWEIDDNGAIVEVADAMPRHFALLGQVQGDKRNRRFVYYDCVASRPAKERTTKNESLPVATDVLNLTITPIEIGGKKIVKGDLELNDTNEAVFDSFFTSVYVPTFTPEV